MRKRRYSREDALDKWLSLDAYMGALRIDNETKRLIAVTFLLLTGRCKLRKSAAMHFHEGWLRRRYGLIEIPAFEPCICIYCYNQAKKNHTEEDDYDTVRDRHTCERYRTKNKRRRYVPIAWSPRIMSAIEEYVQEVGVYSKSTRTAGRLLQEHILPNAEILEPGDVDWQGLRATGDTFWAFSGVSTKARAEIDGHRETELGTYSGSSPIGLLNQVREAKGLEPLDLSQRDPVTDNHAPHPKEPFPDPRTFDPFSNAEPLQPAPAINPRTEERRADVDIERDDFDTMAIKKPAPSVKYLKAIKMRFTSSLEDGDEEESRDPLKEKYDKELDDERYPGQSILEEFDSGINY